MPTSFPERSLLLHVMTLPRSLSAIYLDFLFRQLIANISADISGNVGSD